VQDFSGGPAGSTAVPEPAAFGLIGAVMLLGLAGVRRLRRRAGA